jgi:acyl-CoA synthetase (NDP forming)
MPAGLPEGMLTEVEAKRLIAAYGIPTTRERSAPDAETAVRAAAAIGYPVALKGVSRAVVHKSDFGLVRLGLAGAQVVRAAFADIAAALDRAAPGTMEGCLVQEMAQGGVVEVILGARHDPEYGPMVLAGLAGVRGRPVADIAAAADALVRLSWLAADLGPRLAELDINPLILRAQGRGAIAVDGRAMLRT